MIFKTVAPLWDDSIHLLIAESGADGGIAAYVESMALVQHEPGTIISEPSMRLNKPEAQNLMDALWSVGVRPSSGEGNAGQLGATEKHLEDMRRLVFTSARNET